MFGRNTIKGLLIASVVSWGMPANLAIAAPASTVAPAATFDVDLTEFEATSEWAHKRPKRKWKRSYKRGKYRGWKKRHHRSRPRYRNSGRYIIPGIIIGGIIANEMYRNRAGLPNAHFRYCYAKYRSYRDYDNTFQPYHGPRRQCRSPYWP